MLLNRFGAGYGIYQPLDVLTMLGFVILISTVVNNPILIVEQPLNLLRQGSMAIAEAIRSQVRMFGLDQAA